MHHHGSPSATPSSGPCAAGDTPGAAAGPCAGCRDIPEAIVDRRSRNRRRLKAFAEATDPLSRLRWRNLVVEDNLPLVFSIAGRQGVDTGLAFEDLAQVGSLGLIRAVEAFDPDRNVSLSSFAVPYIQGAIRRERRDRQPMVRPPPPVGSAPAGAQPPGNPPSQGAGALAHRRPC